MEYRSDAQSYGVTWRLAGADSITKTEPSDSAAGFAILNIRSTPSIRKIVWEGWFMKTRAGKVRTNALRIDVMNAKLSPQLSKLIKHEVEAGHFASPEEVITAGVTRIFAESDMSDEEIASLREAARVGVLQADRGEFAEFTAKDIMVEGRALMAKSSQRESG